MADMQKDNVFRTSDLKRAAMTGNCKTDFYTGLAGNKIKERVKKHNHRNSNNRHIEQIY